MTDPRTSASRSTLLVEAVGERELRITRTFDAPRPLVFRAFTEPALVMRWLGTEETPLVEVDIDLCVGGTLRYVWRGETFGMVMTGTFLEVDAPRRLVHTELFDEDWTGGEALNTTVFEAHADSTTVGITMRYASEQARDLVLRSPMEQGMASNYDTLDRVLRDEGRAAR